MGTRNLTCAVLNGEYKIAQYGQWDGYPEASGITVLEFVRDKMDELKFIEKLNKTTEITQEEINARYLEIGVKKKDLKNDFISYDLAQAYGRRYPESHRDIGAGILDLVQNKKGGIKLKRELNFAGSSLFCEWCYVVDLDNRVFEIYEGFNKELLTDKDRFYKYDDPSSEYKPIKLAKKYKFNNLPTNQKFLDYFKAKQTA